MKHLSQRSSSTGRVCIVILFVFLLPSLVSAAADTWTETDSAIYTTDPTKNVGIGTDNPLANFAIQGKRFVVGSNALLGNYSPDDAAFEFQNPDGSVFLNFVSKDGGMVFGSSTFDGGQNGLFSWKHPFVFYMDGKESWRIAPDGNVGIGTTDPNSLLHLKSAGTTLRLEDTAGEPKFSFMDETSTERAFIQLRDTGSDQDALIIRAGSDDIKFRTQSEDSDAQTTLFLGGSGNVGVGKIDPGQRLDVAGYVKGAGLCIGDDCRTAWPSEVNNGTVTGSGVGGYLSKWASSTDLGNSSIFDNGSIGIGTTAPSAKLDIVGVNTQGTVAVQSDIDNGAYLKLERLYQHNSFFFLETGANGEDSLAIHRGTDPYADLVVANNGNVGIGTPTPDTVLTVKAPVGVNDIARFRSDNGNTDVIISAAADQIASIYTLGGQGLSFGTNGGDEQMRLTSSGNVGIGTTNPMHQLQIGGTPSSTIGTVFIGGGGYNSNQAKIALSPDGTGNSSGIVSVYRDTTTAEHFSRLNFGFNDGGNETLMTIKSTGNVGIGTTTPQSLLHLKAANPELRLEGTSGAARLSFYDEVGVQRSFIATSTNGSDNDALLIQVPNDDIKFRTKSAVEDDTSTSMLIAGGSGNVGIGTSTPAYTLDVNGDVKGNRLCIGTDCRTTWPTSDGSTSESVWTTNGTSIYYNSGNVGIGTSSPSYPLDVAGYIRGQTGLCIGSDCRTSWPTSGSSGISGSGTTNYLTKWTGKSTVGDSLIYDDGTKIKVVGGDISIDDSKKVLLGGSSSGEYLTRTCDSTNCYLKLVAGYNYPLVISGDTGNIGIGDTNPDDNKTMVHVSTEKTEDEFSALKGEMVGSTGNTKGVYGLTSSNGVGSGSPAGVFGWATYTGEGGDTFGVLGRTSTKGGYDSGANTAAALYGEAIAPSGLSMGAWGETFSSTNGASGVRGVANVSSGIVYGVHGQTHSKTSGSYGVYSVGPNGSTGYRTSLVYTQQGPTEFYGIDATQVLFEDSGVAQLQNGKIEVTLDPLFLEAVTIDQQNPLQVFVQPYDNVRLYVKPGQINFTVFAADNLRSNAQFAYRVVAKRKYHEHRRLQAVETTIDQFMRPDLTDQQLLEINAQRGLYYDNGSERRARAQYNYINSPKQD